VTKILLIRRMKPLGFTREAMSAAMCDIANLDRPSAQKSVANQRLTDILDDATVRREKPVRQLAMADEFIDLWGHELA
jgi:hypothetical protein